MMTAGWGSGPSGIVLAAGAGTRYGMPKVLAENGDWLRSAVAAMRGAGCGEVVVALGAAVVDPGAARAVPVPDWSAGMSRSVAAALRATRGDVLITLVDTPDVDSACAARVLGAGLADDSGIARAVYRGVPGHPVYVAARHRRALIAALDAAGPDSIDRGVWPHVSALGVCGVDIECGDLASGRDVDVRTGDIRVGGAR